MSKAESMEIASSTAVAEVVRTGAPHKRKKLALKISAAIALILVTAASVTVAVVYSQGFHVPKPNEITMSNDYYIFVAGSEKATHCDLHGTCTEEIYSEDVKKDALFLGDLRDKLLGEMHERWLIERFINYVMGVDHVADIDDLILLFNETMRSESLKDFARKKEKDLLMTFNGSAPSNSTTRGNLHTFPMTSSRNSSRQLSTSAGPSTAPSVSVKTTPDFIAAMDETVKQMQRQDRRELWAALANHMKNQADRATNELVNWVDNLANFQLPLPFTCKAKTRVRRFWRWWVEVLDGAHCEFTGAVSDESCEVRRALYGRDCSGSTTVGMALTSARVETGFDINFDFDDWGNVWLKSAADFELYMKMAVTCERGFDYTKEVGPKIPIMCGGVPCLVLEMGAGFNAKIETAINGEASITFPGNFEYTLGDSPSFKYLAPRTAYDGLATIALSVEAYLYAKASVPALAEVAVKAGIRITGDASAGVSGSKLSKLYLGAACMAAEAGANAQLFIQYSAALQISNPFDIQPFCFEVDNPIADLFASLGGISGELSHSLGSWSTFAGSCSEVSAPKKKPPPPSPPPPPPSPPPAVRCRGEEHPSCGACIAGGKWYMCDTDCVYIQGSTNPGCTRKTGVDCGNGHEVGECKYCPFMQSGCYPGSSERRRNPACYRNPSDPFHPNVCGGDCKVDPIYQSSCVPK